MQSFGYLFVYTHCLSDVAFHYLSSLYSTTGEGTDFRVIPSKGTCIGVRYKLKLIMPEHYASPYTLRTKNVPYSWCNVFFLEPQEDTYAGLN